MFIFSCSEDNSSDIVSQADVDLENTLGLTLSGNQGDILDYFYNLSSDAINAEYHYYDPNAMSNPQFFFEPSTDRLDFFSFPCYLISVTQTNLDPALTVRSLEDSVTKIIDSEVSISSDRYSNVIKYVWDDEYDRYTPQIEANLQQQTSYSYIGDLGADNCPDIFEVGDGTCDSSSTAYDVDSNPDPNSDNYDIDNNPNGTQFDGIYNPDASCLSLNEADCEDSIVCFWNSENSSCKNFTDTYLYKQYRVNYDYQEMGDINGMYYLDTNEWVSKDSTYSSSQYVFEHRFIIPKDVVSQDEMMWRINADCNENNQLDNEAEIYVQASNDCPSGQVFISDPESFSDYGADSCLDAFEDGSGGCQSEPNLGLDGCADQFEDGLGGCLNQVNPDYFSGDPNNDNDNNLDNYDALNNPDGTQGNNQYDDGEEWFDKPSGTSGYDLGFCDRSNQIWDNAEAHLDLEEIADGVWDDIEPYQDRNCNSQYDSGEQTSLTPGVNQNLCENTLNGVWVSAANFDFCDKGNGIWDGPEICQDGSNSCNSSELYSLSDKPNSLVVNYINPDGLGQYDSYSPLKEIILDDDILDRWGNSYENLIETVQDTSYKFAAVDLIDSIVVVLSNPIIEKLNAPSDDYHIAKSEWTKDGTRDYDYHIFRQGEDGYIYKLVHKSYFLPPGFYDAFSEGGFWFEDDATDEVFLYTVDGYLRDGERYQTSRIDTTPVAEYLIDESYSVDYEPVEVPMRKILGATNSEGLITCAYDDYAVCADCDSVDDCPNDTLFNDTFKVTREKTTTMLGTGVEYFEQNITYLVQDFGIVKDDLEFRWNSAPGGTESMVGKYRWEMINKNQSSSDCPSSGSSIMNAILNSKEHINTNDFENIDNFKFEPFKKTKTYGLQRVSE